jgi:hypothetical protein
MAPRARRPGREDSIQIPQEILPACPGKVRGPGAGPLTRAQEEKNIAAERKALPVAPVKLAEPPLLQVPLHRVAIASRHKESGPRPLGGWRQKDGEMPPTLAAAVLQQVPNPVGILDDSAPGQALIVQR